MRIPSKKVNQILLKYGYKLVMDKMHNDTELEKFEKYEKNFNRRRYLTIKTQNNMVIGRVYQINAINDLGLDDIFLDENNLNIILAFFKYFEISNAKKIINGIKKISKINIKNINVDIIRNNVYKQEAF